MKGFLNEKWFIAPAVIGKTGGMAKVVIRRKDENLSIDYPWGTASTYE